MRFPTNNLPPAPLVENRYELRQPDAVAPARAVAPQAGSRQRYLPQRKQTGQDGADQQQGEGSEERRSGDDRRQQGRREAEENVILDTRTGLDRRIKPRRASDTGNKIDEYA